MACYKLSSCTIGNTTVIWSDLINLGPFVGGSISLPGLYPGVCFTVEEILAPCSCGSLTTLIPEDLGESCICENIETCYTLTNCLNPVEIYSTLTNLNPYIGQSVSVNEYSGCFNVGTQPIENCADAPPVTCVEPCSCYNCYNLENCEDSGWVVSIQTTLPLVVGSHIKPIPSITRAGALNNCWKVANEIVPCVSHDYFVTSASNYESCEDCLPEPVCYKLTSCTGSIIYSQTDLSAYVNTYIQFPTSPGNCYYVSVVNDGTCTEPIEVLSPTLCSCPCYTLTDCTSTIAPFNSTSPLGAYVGQTVQLDEYGGCNGPCFEVTVNNGICSLPQNVTVTLGCVPCTPCDETCYILEDCTTQALFLKIFNPTLNSVDLSTLVGQVISKVCLGPDQTECTTGCWTVKTSDNCSGAQNVYVYDLFETCAECNAVCYKLTNCKTFAEIFIQYTVPNPLLPNPSTLVGQVLGSLCFSPEEGGCLEEGCWLVSVDRTGDCVDPINWTDVVSYTEYANCDDCTPKCYLLTECVEGSVPFVVNNDFSLYVGNVVKVCNSEGICKCYNVEVAQSCDGAITIDNTSASFTTCEECNSCDCPPGYTKIGDFCQKITTTPATRNEIIYTVAPGSIDPAYGSLGTRFYTNITFLPYPLTTVSGPDRFIDASSTNVPYITNVAGVWGGPAGSRLNTVGIWTTATPNPLNEWVGFSQCIEIAEEGTYSIGIGGDNFVRIKIDGTLVAETSLTFFSFNIWHVFEVSLTAGTHVIVVEGNNTAGPASFGAEIYNASVATLNGFTTSAQVQAVTVFSTFDKRTGDAVFETGENSGYSCPPGYTYNNCDAPSCSLIETVPFVQCAPTYKVKDCAGVQPDFITNTNLEDYLQGTYKTCITTPVYGDCYKLLDCNRLVGEIYTQTNLSSYIWGTVSFEEYPNSCFIVIPQTEDVTCDPNPLTISGGVTCDCPGAQEPWPNGCYCVTVELVEPPIVASDFTGVFETKKYDCCEDCSRTCYRLTDCQGALDPVVVCNDLQLYVGKVIKISGCGDICWEVEVAENCDGNIIFGGDITVFDDCTDCLPAPPPAPVLELHPRRIKPGYFSPNSKISLEYIEKVNCTFARQVYDSMLVARYGITVCCDYDLPLWTNRKAILDYELLIDPSLCKSTLCDCPAPCVTDVKIDILPTCVAPVVVDTEITLPCDAPVVTDVEINYTPPTPECTCYSVTTLEQPVTITYIDCCCNIQTVILDNVTTYPICAATQPVSITTPDSITVVNNGPCTDSSVCQPPVCYCWKVTNNNADLTGTATFDNCPTVEDSSITVLIPAGHSAYSCGFAPPIVTSGLSVETIGACGEYCGPEPPICACYEVTVPEGTGCTIEYTDCEGTPTSQVYPGGTHYICSQTIPSSLCRGIILAITTGDCNIGTCGE